MLVVWWPVWVPPGGHTTTTKEEERSILSFGAAPDTQWHFNTRQARGYANLLKKTLDHIVDRAPTL